MKCPECDREDPTLKPGDGYCDLCLMDDIDYSSSDDYCSAD